MRNVLALILSIPTLATEHGGYVALIAAQPAYVADYVVHPLRIAVSKAYQPLNAAWYMLRHAQAFDYYSACCFEPCCSWTHCAACGKPTYWVAVAETRYWQGDNAPYFDNGPLRIAR